MFLWWRDVIIEGVTRAITRLSCTLAPLRHDAVHRLRGDVFLRLVLGLLQRFAFPADVHQIADGLQIGVVGRDQVLGGKWPPVPTADGAFKHPFDPWELPLFNTLVLLTSATTVTWAHHSLLTGNRRGLLPGLR